VSVWLGRAGEWVSLRVSETLMILPFTVFAIAVAGTLGNGLHQAMIAVGVLTSPAFFRITRAVALGLRTTQYVEAAELMGASRWWTLRTHIWSKVLPNVAVAAAHAMGSALLVVASLAFLGLGIIPPTPTWGGMLSADLGFLEQQPWAPIFPGVLLVLTVGSLNILADCIREAAAGEARRRRGIVRRAVGRRDHTPIGVPLPAGAVVATEEDRRVAA
jgi:peptide/nickel transport system permease protein